MTPHRAHHLHPQQHRARSARRATALLHGLVLLNARGGGSGELGSRFARSTSVSISALALATGSGARLNADGAPAG